MKNIVLWITGLPGSGKSTIASALKERFQDFVILQMDDFRRIATPAPSYTDTEREIVYRSIVYMAKKLSELGHPVIIDATGNRRRWRDLARELIPAFAEIYLACPINECMKRERVRTELHGAPEDIYLKADEGWPVPGVNVAYEEPADPEVRIDTERNTVKESIEKIQFLLKGFEEA